MNITVLKSKIKFATVTQSELHYEGSCAIDEDFLELAGIRENEKIDIHNISNGEIFTTYAIKAERGSKTISTNGAAAHKAKPKDIIIITSYGEIEENEKFSPKVLELEEDNTFKQKDINYSASECMC